NIAVDEQLIIHFKTLSFEEGEKATKQLLKLPNPPDGIFSSNDTAAVSAILCAKKKGVKIPEELAIIGFNDDPISSIVEPALSTVSHPAVKIGKTAAKQGPNHSSKIHVEEVSEITALSIEIIQRDSSDKK